MSKLMIKTTDLEAKRRTAAEEIAASFDYGYQVVDGSGWETTTPGLTWSKAVYFANDDEPDGPSLKGELTVVFEAENSPDIAMVYAMLNGQNIGSTIVRTKTPLVRANLVMHRYALNWEGDPEIFLSQMLADLRHYAAANKLDFKGVVEESRLLYLEDTI